MTRVPSQNDRILALLSDHEFGSRLVPKIAIQASGCWEWTGTRDSGRYGRISVPGDSGAGVHRVVYELVKGPIPEGLVLDHLCRNPPCVNPSHLEVVTHRENTLRGVGPTAVNAAKTHCKHGHPFDEQNTYHVPRGGHRHCRACHAAVVRRSREKVAA